jgi:hypothetical protein
MLRADRDELSWLRLNWGQEYIVKRTDGVWTATLKWEPELVLSEPTSAKLRAAMFEDAARRRMRSGATSATSARILAYPGPDRGQ